MDELRYRTGRIIIDMGLPDEGEAEVITYIQGASEDDDKPPLVTVLGMLDMARTSAYEMYAEDG